MKTLLLLHRSELTDLYLLIAKYIGHRLDVVHVAYSHEEASRLEASGITHYYNYTALLAAQLADQIIDEALLQSIDKIMIENSFGRFNLNSSLQSDRGLAVLSYQDNLLLAQAHYKVWSDIFSQKKIDFFLHEPCSLFFNHLAAIMCRAQGGMYIWQAQAKNDKDKYAYQILSHDDYSNVEIESNLQYYLRNPDKIDKARCEKFVNEFRQDYSIFCGEAMSHANSVFAFRFKAAKEFIRFFIKKNKYDKRIENIDYWLNNTHFAKEKVRNASEYKKRGIVFEDLPIGERYYYYSFHLEPEAVVLYLGDGIYENQVKLIENIASSLPVGYYLYVKDHPHEYAYRRADDYKRLMNIANIRLIKQSIPGKEVIKNAIGVFSINGTAGFEALLLGKQVYCYGWNYYCYAERVQYIANVRDTRSVVYSQIGQTYTDDSSFMAYINAYLDSTRTGYINYFMKLANKYCPNPEANAEQIADGLIEFSQRF